MIDYLIDKYQLTIDQDLTADQKTTSLLVRRMLDEHLYWVMSYSRWQDERFWPLFRGEFLKNFPEISAKALEKPRSYNLSKYQVQGIGRYAPETIYQAGVEDLAAIEHLLGDKDFIFGKKPHSLDACIYGFLANIYYFEIDTPLRQFIQSKSSLASYCDRMRSHL